MSAKQAKKACATDGLVVVATTNRWTRTPCELRAFPPKKNSAVVGVYAETWPLAVAAFMGWREQWLKEGAK